jgi:L-malate glycosyltransferase
MMNVLIISHTYISRIGREKWRELQRRSDVRLKIIVPTIWRDYLFDIRYEDNRDEELDITALPVWFSGKEAAHVYRSLTLQMRDFAPDILHVEEGTDALSYAQALLFKQWYAPRARTLFFTWMNFEKTLRFPFRHIERWNLRRSDAAICGNSDAVELLRKKGFAKPAHVVPLLGIDPELFSKRDERELRYELSLEGLVIGFIGRFVPEKGVLDLVQAASTLAVPFTLLYVGGGALDSEIRQRAEALGIGGRLKMVKPVPHGEIPRYLNAMDILVLPSYTVPHWREQFGQVVVQAMSCGVPVIGSTHAEIPRVIGDAGLTFDERDVVQLGDRLAQLCASPEMRAQFAEQGRLRVMKNFTNRCIADRTYEIYTHLLVGNC